MNISFIGYGHIAQAMTRSLARDSNYKLYAAAPSLQIGVHADHVHTHHDNLAILKGADVIILAVKPLQVAEVLAQIKQAIPPHALLISLAAGLSLSWLEKHSVEQQAIVRAMPNTPIAVNKGATALMANAYVSEEQKAVSTQLFQSMGISTWVTDEDNMDTFTALSGSGPAYVFLFLEAMIHTAEALGLDKALARTFALQTVRGAVELAQASELSVTELREHVTSSKGTTAAAIQVLKEEQFEKIVFKAMRAAFRRSKALAIEMT
ncbi:MAG: pyrroline-5-carboxylate reductase [Legionellaceae bacterium]